MASPNMLLTNATATGNAIPLPAGDYCYAVDGTFNGATAALQMLSPDGSSWLTIADTGLTAEGAVIVSLPDGRFRCLITGGPPSAMYASLKRAGSW